MLTRFLSLVVLSTLTASAPGQVNLPPQTDADVTLLDGRPSVALGNYRLTRLGNTWAGASGTSSMTVEIQGNTLYLEMKLNGRLWHGNTILTIDPTTYTFRLGGLDGSGEVRVRVRR